MLSFPSNFYWGAATAAHQVEGQNYDSDWAVWENQPGKIKHDDSSQVACNWWGGTWRDDFDRARALGMNAQRISIEWARMEPRQGDWNASAFAQYREMIQGLRARGMEPFVTLHHFTSPQWVAERGGFENPKISQWMSRYADRAAREFGDLVNFWMTVNEPNIYAYQSYMAGTWLAQKRDPRASFNVITNLVRAHAAMFHAIKRVAPDAQVGYAQHWRAFEPLHENSLLDRAATGIRARLLNELFYRTIEDGHMPLPRGLRQAIPEAYGTRDFIGVNYYYHEHTAFDLRNAAQVFGRSVFHADVKRLRNFFESTGNVNPHGFFEILMQLRAYEVPLYITENGLYETDRDDQLRYLITHLRALHDAMEAGTDVRGYFWWSLLDNFEWSEGFTPRFGLYHTDYATQTRTLKPVGQVYAQIIRANGILDELIEKYGREN